MVLERGTNVPFTIRNYAYWDSIGRETVTWIRDFQTRRPRRFDADMILSQRRGKHVDSNTPIAPRRINLCHSQ